ncbi:MAG: arsenate reductase ArsC [Fimbriimonadales bacterium]
MTRVLFVCVHNAGRSQMAESFLNHFAKERGLKIEAVSAGTASGASLNPLAVQAMNELGISMEGHKPKLLTQELADSADQTVTMGCGVGACSAKVLVSEDWGLNDAAGQPIERVREIRDQIRAKVEGLIEHL